MKHVPLRSLRIGVFFLLAAAAGAGAVHAANGGPASAASSADPLDAWMRAGFGGAVAVAGEEVLVGEARNSMRPGIVYIYRRNAQGNWVESGRLTASDARVADGFGVSIVVDGSRMIVGAMHQNAPGGSAAYIFERDASGTWRQTAKLNSPDSVPTGFGAAVALSGDVALVGAPITGGTLVTGGMGAVHVFQRDASGNWTITQQLTVANANLQTLLGVNVAMAGDRALVTSPSQGVFAFRREGGQWREIGKLPAEVAPTDQFGMGMALAGNEAFVGAPGRSRGQGAVLAFRWDDAQQTWVSAGDIASPVTGEAIRFGNAVARDGDRLLVGAPRAANGGAIYVFRRSGQTWGEPTRIQPESLGRNDAFGTTVAVSGQLLAAGLLNADYGAGKAMILELAQPTQWRTVATLASEPESLPTLVGEERRCMTGEIAQFSCGNVDLLAFMPISEIGGARGVELNDIWGWTDPQTGKEYALVGRIDGTSFVDISNPTKPVFVGDLPMTEGAVANAWRDIKVYKDHAFIVADGAGQHGMQVFDLTRLRQFNGTPLKLTPDTTYDRIASAHNIVINEESGFAYSVGSSSGGETCGGGLHMIDIREPKKPKFAGCFSDPQTGRAGTGYSHDAQCVMYKGPDPDYQGREICIGANETMLSVADVTDKQNPKAVSRVSYPNVGYTHQGWFTEDQRYFLVDDELDEMNGSVNRTRTLVWDMTDLDDPQLVKEYLGETAASDHNLYVKDNLVYASNYAAGLRVLDITDPLNPVEVGHFDVQPFGEDRPSFTGSWSNYPYFRSGVVVVTGIEQGLFVVRYRPTRPVS